MTVARLAISVIGAFVAGSAQGDPPDEDFTPDRIVPPAEAGRPPAIGIGGQRGPGPVRLLTQVNVDTAGMNIVGDAANEPSIAVSPVSPNRMAIGWRQFDSRLSSNREAGYAWTHNGGRTWTKGEIQPGVFRSDPVLDADAEGNFYYQSLEQNFRCTIFKSTDGGRTWPQAVFAYGGDKNWMAVDRSAGSVGLGNVYGIWKPSITCCGGAFTRSRTGAASFETPVSLPGQPERGTVAVGPDGEVFVAGEAGAFVVTRSLTARDGAPPVTFDLVRPVNLGAAFVARGTPNPDGLVGQVWTAVDGSSGPTRGWVYILNSARPAGTDPADVMFARSRDGGLTWDAPVRINQDPPAAASWQWFATMSCSPSGRIDVVWNDTSESQNARISRLYYASSSDGGATWSAGQPISAPWDSHLGWPQQAKIGDYYHMVSDDVGAHLAWAATLNGEQDVYYMRIGDYDCNNNGVGDADDLAAGTSRDANADGVPDECQCLADWNWDVSVNSADISAFLTTWLQGVQSGSDAGDYNADDAVNSADISAFLADWVAAVQSGC